MITTMHSDQNASPPRVEVITSVQRRRRWPTAERRPESAALACSAFASSSVRSLPHGPEAPHETHAIAGAGSRLFVRDQPQSSARSTTRHGSGSVLFLIQLSPRNFRLLGFSHRTVAGPCGEVADGRGLNWQLALWAFASLVRPHDARALALFVIATPK